MEHSLGQLDIHSTSAEYGDYMDRFEIWCLTRKDLKEDKLAAHFLSFIGKDVYSLLRNLAYPEKPLSLSYEKLKKLLLGYVSTGHFECRERAQFHKLVHQEARKIKDFILELQIQAAKYNSDDQLNVQLRDPLITGIKYPALEKELIQLPKPTFQDVKSFCIHFESVNSLNLESMRISISLLSRSKEMNLQDHMKFRKFNERNTFRTRTFNGGVVLYEPP